VGKSYLRAASASVAGRRPGRSGSSTAKSGRLAPALEKQKGPRECAVLFALILFRYQALRTWLIGTFLATITLVKPGLLLTCGFATKAFLVAMRLLIRDFLSIAI
jgi:hypothetical protein